MTCDRCEKPAEFLIYAAHDIESVHPLVSRYPAAMHRSCEAHLADHLTADAAAPGSTMQWVVKPA